MRTAVGGMNVIGKGEEIFVVALIILHGDFHGDGIVLILGREIDHVGMNHLERALLMNELYEAADTALVAEIILDNVVAVALVAQLNMYAGIEKRLFSQAALKHLVFVNGGFLENFGVSLEAHLGALDVGLADFLQLVDNLAAFIALKINILAVADLDLQPFGERVDDGSADAVQTAGDLVTAAAELAAGMQNGKDDRHRRKTCLAVDADRNTSAVIGDADDVAGLNHHVNLGAVTGKRLVDGVIDNLINQMVQTARSCGTDIHARTLSDSLQAFEHLNFVGAVFLFNLGNFDIFFVSFDILCILHNLPLFVFSESYKKRRQQNCEYREYDIGDKHANHCDIAYQDK